eukprot:4171943-Pleurochrysis_carterae.AAC.2
MHAMSRSVWAYVRVSARGCQECGCFVCVAADVRLCAAMHCHANLSRNLSGACASLESYSVQ